MSELQRTLSSEEAAERLTNLAGWVCKTCRRFYGDEGGAERAARYCCQKDHACGTEGCKNRADRSYTICDPCRGLKDIERWKALPEVEWDGETPLVMDDDDKYFFSQEDLEDYLEEQELKLDDVRLVLAEDSGKPLFEMHEFLTDYLCEDNSDQLPDTKKIDGIVNRWIDKNTPTTWYPSKKRPSLASLRKYVKDRFPEAEQQGG